MLAGILALALVWLGAVSAEVRAGIHAGLAVALVVGWWLPRPALRPAADRVQHVAAATWALVMAAGVGLLPLDRSVGGLLAPGIFAARPDDPWWTAALAPEEVAWAIAHLVLVGSAGALAAVWGARQPDDERLGDALIVGSLALVAAAAGHAASGAEAVFGWIPTSRTGPGPLFGPLVNANHLGGLLLLGWPVALVRSVGVGWRAWLARAVALGVPIVVVWVGARGPAALLVAQAIGVALLTGRSWATRWWVVAGLAATVLPLAVAWGAGERGGADSVAGRLRIWRDGLATWLDHPLFGVGAGGFEGAFEAYRTDRWNASVAHAHHDLLEWVVETGVVGVLALALVGAVAWRGFPRALDTTGRALALGLLGLLGHSLVDFPLAIPAIGMVASAVAGALGAKGEGQPGAGARTGRLLLALALLNLLGVALSAQRALVDAAELAVRGDPVHPERTRREADRLAWLAPWRGWDRLAAAWRAERAGDPEKAVVEVRAFVGLAADDDDALRPAALVLMRAGHLEEAAALADRAIARGDVDYRNHVARARVALALGDRLDAAERYAAAIERDAPWPVVDEALEALPVAVWWIDRLEGVPYQGQVLALRLATLGDPEEALLAFEVAASGDPALPQSPMAALVAARAGRHEEALARAEALAAGGDPVAVRTLGQVHLLAGRPEEALDAWQRVEDDFPVVRAWIVREVGRIEGPEAGLRRAERYRLAGLWSDAIELEAGRLAERAP